MEEIVRLNELKSESDKIKQVHVPEFFRLSNPSDKEKLQRLIQENKHLSVHDEMIGQLEELVKSLNPDRPFPKQILDDAVKAHLKDTRIEDYGVWVFYPWSNKVIHILDEKEFVEARTNRNKNKITTDEQRLLATKSVGVIGLSVGSSVSTTLALERIVGELRIADNDILELTNLNRIRTGLHNLGITKVVAVAREIAEIDPFLKVVCFHEGITEANLDSFILDGGKLDVLIDECDGLDIKIACRERAKFHRVPVLMEASERGTIDVERFDLEPERPILHGLLHDMDPQKAKAARTNEEKMPFMMQIVGLGNLSDRMRSSLLEITQTVNTWPQLASAVTYGGGMTADICRRMLLDQYRESGRYIVDIADLVADGSPKIDTSVEESTSAETPEVELAATRNYHAIIGSSEKLPDGFYIPSETEITSLVSTAIKAPSGGNNQPWKWIYRSGILYLVHEVDASTQYLDFRHRGAYIGLGAAIENLELEAYSLDLETEVKLYPEEDQLLIAKIFFRKLSDDSRGAKKIWHQQYYPFLDQRATNRRVSKRVEIPAWKYDALKKVASEIPGATLIIKSSDDELETIAKIVGKSERTLLTNETSHREFYNEIKWKTEDAIRSRTGIDMRTVDVTNTELAGFNLARKWSVVKNLIRWGGGGAFEKLGKKCIDHSSAVGLLTMPSYSRLDFLNGGKAMQRIWIKCAELNIAIQPMSAAIFLFARLVKGNNEGLSDDMIKVLSEIRVLHEEVFGINNEPGEIFLFRLHESEEMTRSLRKPVEEVLVFDQTQTS